MEEGIIVKLVVTVNEVVYDVDDIDGEGIGWVVVVDDTEGEGIGSVVDVDDAEGNGEFIGALEEVVSLKEEVGRRRNEVEGRLYACRPAGTVVGDL